MFWELDKGEHEQEFICITNYLLSFFEFAAGTAANSFDESEFRKFRPAFGDWMIARLKSDRKKISMRETVKRIFLLPQDRRVAIYDALTHDVRFAESIDKPFYFKTPELETEEIRLIRCFFVHFYEVVLKENGYPIPGYEVPYTRKAFANAYFSGKNSKYNQLCPVCLTTSTDAKNEHDVEHFFPKSQYPALALHHVNLYFTCRTCNQDYKKEKNPLDKPTDDARKSFLPYFDTVRDKVRLKFPKGIVKIEPLNNAGANDNERVEAFVRLFELDTRWTSVLKDHINSLVTHFLNGGEAELLNELSESLRYLSRRWKNNPEHYLKYMHTQWLCDGRVSALYAELAHDGTEPNRDAVARGRRANKSNP